jgi:hypothetical protein
MARKPEVVNTPPPKPRLVNALAPLAPCHFIQVMLFKRRLRLMAGSNSGVALSGREMAERWRQRRRDEEGQKTVPSDSKLKG